MFGYVRVFKPELKIKDYESYKGVYCSLCKSLGKQYGLIVRCSLNYDFTALALLELALNEENMSFEKGCCVCNPLKKCMFCKKTEVIDAVATKAMILFYHKVEDTTYDEKGFRRFGAILLKFLLKKQYKKAMTKDPETAKVCARYIKEQTYLEKNGKGSIDQMAEPTAKFMQELVCFGKQKKTDISAFERFGYCLGRYIYLMDAADDFVDDVRKKRYNPYVECLKMTTLSKENIQEMQCILNQTLAELYSAYKKMTFYQFADILDNIVCDGMSTMVDNLSNN